MLNKLLKYCLGACLWIITSASAFELTDIRGQALKQDDARGKWLIVNFWATWCPPCLEEIPLLAEFYDLYPDDLVIWGVKYWDRLEDDALNDFMDTYGVNYPIIDGDAEVNQSQLSAFASDISGLPMTFIYDQTGQLFTTIKGELNRQTLSDLINQ